MLTRCLTRFHWLLFFITDTDAHRALELLEEYHAKLTSPQDKQLRTAIERVIHIFKSRLFQALLGKWAASVTPSGGVEGRRSVCVVCAEASSYKALDARHSPIARFECIAERKCGASG